MQRPARVVHESEFVHSNGRADQTVGRQTVGSALLFLTIPWRWIARHAIRGPEPYSARSWASVIGCALGHLTSQLLGPLVICPHCLMVAQPELLLGISGGLPKNVGKREGFVY
jgi:hypothetical protein